MTSFIEGPSAADLGPGQRTLLRVGGASIALFHVDGAYHAIDDSCPHNGASLLSGKLEGRILQCPAHGLRFDLATGCMRGGSLAVRVYPVTVAGGRLRVMLPTREGDV